MQIVAGLPSNTPQSLSKFGTANFDLGFMHSGTVQMQLLANQPIGDGITGGRHASRPKV